MQALLTSPTAVERETAELTRAGTLRRIVVPRRGTIGESLILMADLEGMIKASKSLEASTKETFIGWLKDNPTAQIMPRTGNGLSAGEVNDLVREGFLTAQHSGRRPTGSSRGLKIATR